MDPVTALGLVSAVATLIAYGIEVGDRLQQLSTIGAVPEAFRHVQVRLPLIIAVLRTTEADAHRFSPDDRRAIMTVVEECQQQIAELERVMLKITVGEGDSRLKRTCKAGISIFEERRVNHITQKLGDNLQLLNMLSTAPMEKEEPTLERRPSEALTPYAVAVGLFMVPFSRDDHFVGRDGVLRTIATSFQKQTRVAVSGIGGIG
jgi:hypothetical protein